MYISYPVYIKCKKCHKAVCYGCTNQREQEKPVSFHKSVNLILPQRECDPTIIKANNVTIYN